MKLWGEKEKVRVIGPCDATIARINDRYRRVIYLKHTDYDSLVNVKNKAEAYLENSQLAKECFISFDFDPIHSY